MRRIVLFSTPSDNNNLDIITNLIFPEEFSNKKPIFMPAHGLKETPIHYITQWEKILEKYGMNLNLLDNTSSDIGKEIDKLLCSNILIISGGDTFKLLHNLRKSGLDNAIKKFVKKDEFILAAYSAGAYILTPSISLSRSIRDYGSKRELGNEIIKINDFSGLGIVNFEIFAHYSRIHHEKFLQDYRRRSKNEIREIPNNGYIALEL